MTTKQPIHVLKVFPIRDQGQLIVHLASFDWDFTLGLSVRLSCGDVSVPAQQVGFGNHEGMATVVLAPQIPWKDAEQIVRRLHENDEGSTTLSVEEHVR